MKKQVLSFSSGCAINFDDLGDFPDYFEIITKLVSQIKQGKADCSTLRTFLDADLQDVQHISQFKELMHCLTSQYQHIINKQMTSEEEGILSLKDLFIIFLLKVAKNCFTSFSFQEEESDAIFKILQKQLPKYQNYWIDFLLSIASFAPYIEKHEQIVNMFLKVTNQKIIFSSEQMSLPYMKSIDKILRYRTFKKCLRNKLEQKQQLYKNLNYFCFKYYLHRHSNEEISEHFTKFVDSVDQEKISKFVDQYIKQWSKKIHVKNVDIL